MAQDITDRERIGKRSCPYLTHDDPKAALDTLLRVVAEVLVLSTGGDIEEGIPYVHNWLDTNTPLIIERQRELNQLKQ